MKVFITGASGFIGSAVVSELAESGHEVVGLARSDASASKIKSLGCNVSVIRGTLEDLEVLKKGATECDGVIHLGFVHDFDNYDKCCEIDRRACVAMLDTLIGTQKPFIFTNGTFALSEGKLAFEKDRRDQHIHNLRGINEEIVLAYKSRGVKVMGTRLAPTVHGKGDTTFIPMLIQIAKTSGKSAYIGNGQNLWAAVHRLDVANLYTLILEKGCTGSIYHGVAEQGIQTKDIANTIGEILSVPVVAVPQENAEQHFGSLTYFFARDGPVSNEHTCRELAWKPCNLGLILDMEQNYRS